MTQQKRRGTNGFLRLLALVLSAAAALGLLLPVGVPKIAVVPANAQAVSVTLAGEAGFEPSYFVGDEVAIPQGTITAGEQTINAKATVVYPDGSAYSLPRVTLSQAGLYKVVYGALFGARWEEQAYTFVANKRRYEVSGTSSVVYGAHPNQPQRNGLVTSLGNGDKLIYNEVIDLSAGTKYDALFDMFVTPQKEGICDFMQFRVRLVDVYDASNFINIVAARPDLDWVVNQLYIQVGPSGSGTVGQENPSTIHRGGIYGTPTNCSFEKIAPVGSFSVSYDAAERTFYAMPAMRFIADLDDPAYFSNPWGGFTTGQVRMELWADGYAGAAANFVIEQIRGNNNLAHTLWADTTAPLITLDAAQEDIVQAVPGFAYRLPGASAVDGLFATPVTTRVYLNYHSNNRSEYDVKNGAFTPNLNGTYTIVYTAVDDYGNRAERILSVTCADRPAALTAVFGGGYPTTGKAGESVALADLTVSGEIGGVSVQKAAKLNGKVVYDNLADAFRPEFAGAYELVYTYSDYVESKTISYTLTVANGGAPIFIEAPKLPAFFMSGITYALPEVFAVDYSSGTPVQVKATVKLTDKNGERTLTGKAFTPMINGAQALVTLTFSATNAAGTTSRTLNVPTADVGFVTGVMHMERYFYGDNIAAAAAQDFVSVTVSQDATFSFINTLTDNFSLSFNVDTTKNRLTTFDVYLTDSENPDVVVKASYRKKDNSSSYFQLNDTGLSLSVAGSFTTNTVELSLKYDPDALKMYGDGNLSVSVDKTLSGAPFAGFPSRKVNVSFGVGGVTGVSAVQLKRLNAQPLNNSTEDYIRPQVVSLTENARYYRLNETVSISPAIAGDVLDPVVNFKMSVTAPDKSYVTASDGTVLQDVDPGVAYSFLATEYGRYSVSIIATDTAGRAQEYGYVVNIYDDTAPVFTFDGAHPTQGTVGVAVKLPGVTVSDNVDGVITGYTVTLFHHGQATVLTKNAFTVHEAGIYTVRYFAADAVGNVATASYTIEIK
jgi:hypothetical protein